MANWSRPFFTCKLTTCIITSFCPEVSSGIIGFGIQKPLAAVVSVLLMITFAITFSTACGYLKMDKTDMTMNYANLYLNFSFICLLFFILVVVYMRYAMRKQRDIEGNLCQDCVLGLLCTKCTLCQMLDHLREQPDKGPRYETLTDPVEGEAIV